jgi:hypothetical protein
MSNRMQLIILQKKLKRKMLNKVDMGMDKDGNGLRIFFPLKYKDITNYDILFDLEQCGYEITIEYQEDNFIVCTNIYDYYNVLLPEEIFEEVEETIEVVSDFFRFIDKLVDSSIYDNSKLIAEVVNLLDENGPKDHHWTDLDKDSNYLEINVKGNGFSLDKSLENINLDDEVITQIYQEWWDKIEEYLKSLNSEYILDFGSIGRSNGYAVVKIDNSIPYDEIMEDKYGFLHLGNIDEVLDQMPTKEEIKLYRDIVQYIEKERDKFYEEILNKRLKEIYLI